MIFCGTRIAQQLSQLSRNNGLEKRGLLFFLKEVCFCPLNNREFAHEGQRKTERDRGRVKGRGKKRERERERRNNGYSILSTKALSAPQFSWLNDLK